MQKALYDRFSGKFYVLCQRYSPNDSVAQEVLSDGFLCVFEQINNYRGEGSFEGWMRTIFLRYAIRRYKQENRHEKVNIDEENKLPHVVSNHESQLDVRKALMDAMRQLPAIERQTFNLVAVEGYKLDEAAKLLEENISTLKSRYYKVLQKMKTMLTKTLGEEYLKE